MEKNEVRPIVIITDNKIRFYYQFVYITDTNIYAFPIIMKCGAIAFKTTYWRN